MLALFVNDGVNVCGQNIDHIGLGKCIYPIFWTIINKRKSIIENNMNFRVFYIFSFEPELFGFVDLK